MWSTPSLNLNYKTNKMKTKRLIEIVAKLRDITTELQDEINCNETLNVDYDEVLQYIERNNEGC